MKLVSYFPGVLVLFAITEDVVGRTCSRNGKTGWKPARPRPYASNLNLLLPDATPETPSSTQSSNPSNNTTTTDLPPHPPPPHPPSPPRPPPPTFFEGTSPPIVGPAPGGLIDDHPETQLGQLYSQSGRGGITIIHFDARIPKRNLSPPLGVWVEHSVLDPTKNYTFICQSVDQRQDAFLVQINVDSHGAKSSIIEPQFDAHIPPSRSKLIACCLYKQTRVIPIQHHLTGKCIELSPTICVPFPDRITFNWRNFLVDLLPQLESKVPELGTYFRVIN